MNAFRKRCIAYLALFCLILPALFSCAESDDDFLAWNKAPLSFVGVYEADGISLRAHFSLNGRDDVAVTLLSPSEGAGIVYEKKGAAVTARCGDTAIPLSTSPAAVEAALLCYPESPVLDKVLSEGAVRTETVRASGGVYKIRYGRDGLPEEILLESGGAPFSLFIESFDAP